jgi:hypothetical protein
MWNSTILCEGSSRFKDQCSLLRRTNEVEGKYFANWDQSRGFSKSRELMFTALSNQIALSRLFWEGVQFQSLCTSSAILQRHRSLRIIGNINKQFDRSLVLKTNRFEHGMDRGNSILQFSYQAELLWSLQAIELAWAQQMSSLIADCTRIRCSTLIPVFLSWMSTA